MNIIPNVENCQVIKRRPKNFEDYNVNPEAFFNIKTKEIAYILGLIWADGHVCSKGRQNQISLNSTAPDGNEFYQIFKNTGKWGFYQYPPRTRCKKESIFITTNNYFIADFLIKNGYNAKSEKSADDILSKIPINLRLYWFRGLFDGDGCIYISPKNTHFQVSVSSSFGQDWAYLETLLRKLKINYRIQRRQHKAGGKSSCIRITNKSDCLKFLNFIYDDSEKDKIFLSRKYEKYKIIKNLLSQ